MNEHKIGLTEGLVITCLPAIGYWVAFLYERGYCDFFNIPVMFINIGILNVFLGILSILHVIIFFYLIASMIPFFNSLSRSLVVRLYLSPIFAEAISDTAANICRGHIR